MKFIYFTILILLSSCATGKYTTSKHLQLEDAYMRSFVKGMQQEDGKHSGTTYSMIFNDYDGVTIKNVWIGQNNIEFESFDKDGLLYVIATRYSQISVNSSAKMKTAPFTYEGKALIEYNYNDKNDYLIIESFEVREKTEGQ